MNVVYTWLLLTAALLVIEALTAGLTTIWFAGGSIVALILTFLGRRYGCRQALLVPLYHHTAACHQAACPEIYE